jgi:hypothetical protein
VTGASIAARRANRLAASGRNEYQIHVPRRSVATQPASRSTRRWCEIVGWLSLAPDVKSQAQTGPVSASWVSMRKRVGSAAAVSSLASGSVVATTIEIISISAYIDVLRYI